MAGRTLPSLQDFAGELTGLETPAVGVPGQVLGHQAMAIPLGLGPLEGLSAVRLMAELARRGDVLREDAGGGREDRIGLHFLQGAGLAEGVRHFDDGDLGLGQVR